MAIIIFIVVVLVLLALVLWGLRTAPIPPPLNWILQLLAILVAVLVIGHRAGMF